MKNHYLYLKVAILFFQILFINEMKAKNMYPFQKQDTTLIFFDSTRFYLATFVDGYIYSKSGLAWKYQAHAFQLCGLQLDSLKEVVGFLPQKDCITTKALAKAARKPVNIRCSSGGALVIKDTKSGTGNPEQEIPLMGLTYEGDLSYASIIKVTVAPNRHVWFFRFPNIPWHPSENLLVHTCQ